MSTEQLSPLIIYEKENLRARVEQINRLKKIGLEVFCEEWIRDPNLAHYFPSSEFKCVVEDPDRMKVYFYFMTALLDCFGLEMVDYVRGSFKVKQGFFIQAPAKISTLKIYSFVLDSMGDMGFIPHILEIFNVMHFEFRRERIDPSLRLELPKHTLPVRNRLVRKYCKLQVDPESGARKIVWENSNSITTATLPVSFQRADQFKITDCAFKFENVPMRLTLCHHGLLVKIKTRTVGICTFTNEANVNDLSCGYEVQISK